MRRNHCRMRQEELHKVKFMIVPTCAGHSVQFVAISRDRCECYLCKLVFLRVLYEVGRQEAVITRGLLDTCVYKWARESRRCANNDGENRGNVK